VTACLIAGCREPGSGPVALKPVEETMEESQGEAARVTVDEVTVETRGEDGTAWRLRGKSSGIGVEGEALQTAVLQDVSGELMSKGKVVSRLQSGEARVDQKLRRLVLSGRVRVQSLSDDLVLTANKVSYAEGGEHIEAVGAVSLEGRGLRLGPSPALLATPDLLRIGTEDRLR
jgi:hypothetical protein